MDEFYFECQNEVEQDACYHTLDVERGARKYRKGFVCVLQGDNAVVLVGYNSVGAYANLILGAEEDFQELDDLQIGESVELRGSGTYTRIW